MYRWCNPPTLGSSTTRPTDDPGTTLGSARRGKSLTRERGASPAPESRPGAEIGTTRPLRPRAPACARASERRRWSWQGASARAHRAWRGPRSEATRGEAGQYVWSDRGGEVDGGEGLSPAALRCRSRDAELREQVRVSGPYELLLDPVVVGAAGAAVHVVSRARTGASASARVESEKSEGFRLARLHRDGYRMFSAVAGSRSSRPTRSAASSSLRTRASPSASKLPWASRSPATTSCSKSPRSSCTKCRP